MEKNESFEGFGTVEQSLVEDQFRLDRLRELRRALQANPKTTSHWLRRDRDRLWPTIEAQGLEFDLQEIDDLIRCLQYGLETGEPAPTLASSLTMRSLREQMIAASMALIEAHGGESEWKTFTVIKDSWSLTPVELQGTSAKQLTHQFRTDLNRAGVAGLDGPLVTFIDGEFDPTTGRVQLHPQGLGEGSKVDALHGLKGRRGYQKTSSGAAPIQTKDLQHGARQLSYQMKSYWSGQPTIDTDNGPKRVRADHRILEPYGSHFLLWRHRQQLADMAVLQGVWSPKFRGTLQGRELYLIIKRGLKTLPSNRVLMP